MAPSTAIACPQGTPLAAIVTDIREWLEHESIEPLHFRTVINATSLGFEIGFTNEEDAERFRRRFSSFEPVYA
jgi:hypothetical protein